LKAREIIKLIEADGWQLHSQKGSHQQYTHPTKKGRVTVPIHGSKDIKTAILQSILKQAGLK
jgi:predicted RNA binding protein YcfA (HicA-like mRNA interferase family)